MNAPNGLLYKAGEWHLGYQYYLHDTVWGRMHWAHAVSRKSRSREDIAASERG